MRGGGLTPSGQHQDADCRSAPGLSCRGPIEPRAVLPGPILSGESESPTVLSTTPRRLLALLQNLLATLDDACAIAGGAESAAALGPQGDADDTRSDGPHPPATSHLDHAGWHHPEFVRGMRALEERIRTQYMA